jgi:O-antigen ligase
VAEYAFYGIILNAAFSLISVPLSGAGLVAALAFYCVHRVGLHSRVYEPLKWAVGCGIIFVIVQCFVHDQPLTQDDNRNILIWILMLIIVQSLALRPGFLRRFAFATLVVELLMLLHLKLAFVSDYDATVNRAGLEGGSSFANPNDLAAWFGFCCVYFSILTIETKRNITRICWLIVGAGSLFVVGLTVSRGTLAAIVIALIVALRRILKRGFLPVLLIAVFIFVVLFSGLFDQIIEAFLERGTEETGRLLLWPLLIQRVFESPLTGVGVAEMATFVAGPDKPIVPHNTFLYFVLTSGIIPLGLFIAYWMKAIRGAYHLAAQRLDESSFVLPLLVYTFVVELVSQTAFMFPWAIVTLGIAISRRGVHMLTPKEPMSKVAGRLGVRGPYHYRSSRRRFLAGSRTS